MQEQRDLPALRALIDKLLDNGWEIIGRDPLQLRSGRRTYVVMHGMLISAGQRSSDRAPAIASTSVACLSA